MYTITIKNFYENGVLNKENEKTLYHIPIQDGEEENVLTDPTVSCDLGKTGTMEFTIHPNHPYYHAIAQMRTIMRVEYDGDTIFRGRILTVDNTMTGAKRIHCEGDMAFLLDSFQMGTKKETRPTINLNAYIQQILNTHNQQMQESGETDKCIYPGDIPGAYRATMVSSIQQIAMVSDTFGSNSTEQSLNALESLTKVYGGYFRTRYSKDDNGVYKTYLDWYKYWFSYNSKTNTQPIAITQNIIDAQSNSEVDNIFTALIPIGSNEGEDIYITGYKTDIHGNNNRILVPQITKVFTEDELSTGYMTKSIFEKAVDQYGIIYKVEQFSNADTQEKLWTYACDWIRNNYVGGITSYDLTAMDMHHVDNRVAKYLVGDRVELDIHSDMTELDEYNSNERSNIVNRTLLSVKYDLHHPDKNGYTAGIPSDILNREYGTKSTSKSTSSGGGGGGGKGAGGRAGGRNNDDDDTERERKAREKAQDALAWKLVWDETYNNKEYNALKSMNGGAAVKPALNTSQLIIKQIISDPEIDTGKEVMETVAMVLDGQKKAARFAADMSAPGLRPLMEKLEKRSPFLKKLVEMDEGYQRAVASISLNAGLKQVGVSGKKDAALNRIVDGALSLGITEDTPIDQAVSMIQNVTNGVTLPNTVASVGSAADANGNEAGFLEIGKEALTNAIINGDGNNGSGTIDIGKTDPGANWLIQMNQPLQWKDPDTGRVYTLPNGTIDANDFSLIKKAKENVVESFSAQVGVFKTAIADNLSAINANFGKITALEGTIDNLTAKAITTDNLSSTLSRLSTIAANNIECKNNVSCGSLSVGGRNIGYVQSLKVVTAVNFSNETIATRSLYFLGTVI